ncbi:MAG: hydrolase 2, exosortase A system-associated [Alphaproteobacteria bacterium]
MSQPDPAPAPLFLDGPKGRLFAMYYPPADAVGDDRPAALFLPPFAEEMNRARYMAALLGRSLSARGVGCLALDLYGTGDSEGDFADARWDVWRRDAAAARDWLVANGHDRVSVVGLRLGACLALDAFAPGRDTLQRIVAWQPVLRGAVLINQFLRTRVAGSIGGGAAGGDGAAREDTKSLRRRLAAGEALEIGGYMLAPELAAAIDGLRFAKLALGAAKPLVWLDCAASEGAGFAPAAQAAIAGLRESGADLDARIIAGEAFWVIEETTMAPALLEATADAIAGPRP